MADSLAGKTMLGPIGARLQARAQQPRPGPQSAPNAPAVPETESRPTRNRRLRRWSHGPFELSHDQQVVSGTACDGVDGSISFIPNIAADVAQAVVEGIADALSDCLPD